MAQEYADQYQWIKGDKIGNIETFGVVKEGWVYFQSGKRINTELLNEFMMPVGADPALHTNMHSQGVTKEVRIPRQPGAPGTSSATAATAEGIGFKYESGDNDDTIRDAEGNVYNKPPTRTAPQRPKPDQRKQPKHNPRTEQPKREQPKREEPKKEINPVTLLIDKSKKESVAVTINLDIELPKQGVYDVIADSFDVDVNKELADYVLSNLNEGDFKNLFKEAVEKEINSFYNK